MLLRNALLIGLAFLVFAVPHSLTAGWDLKTRLKERLGERLVEAWYRLAYNVLAVLLILPPFALAAVLPDQPLYTVATPWNWLMRAIQIAGIAGVVVSLLSTDLWRFAGLTQVVEFLSNTQMPTSDVPLQTGGMYRLVRHPLYLFSLMILWPMPVMTFNMLIFNIAATVYFALGSLVEERRLERAYGEAYRAYRQQVPWLIPWPRG